MKEKDVKVILDAASATNGVNKAIKINNFLNIYQSFQFCMPQHRTNSPHIQHDFYIKIKSKKILTNLK